MIYGIDVSDYQPNFDFSAARREGYEFAIIKSSEGTGWKAQRYRRHVQAARDAGMLVAAYHYVRGNDVAGQLNNIKSMVTVDTPVILDIEDGAGSIGSIRALNKALNDAGYATPLIYIPRWYWQGHMGSPDLSGLPPLWHSRYPDNTARYGAQFDLSSGAYWPEFGGLKTAIAQFTSSLRVANYPDGNIDGNAYKGSREQLAALFGGQEGDDVGHVDTISNEAVKQIIDALRYAPMQGPEGDSANYNDGWFWTNRFANLLPGLVDKVNAIGDVLAQIAENDSDVSLDPEQFSALRADVKALGDVLDAGFDELSAELVGKDEQAIQQALRSFFGRAVSGESNDEAK